MLLTKGLMLSEENVTNLEYIQKQIAIIISFLAFVLLLLLGISDIILGMSPVIVWVKIGLSFPFIIAYYLVSKYGKVQLAVNILLVLAHVVICFNFLYNDGNDGPTIYAFFLLLVISSLLIQGWLKVAWFIGSLSMFFLLFLAETKGYIEVVHYYDGPENQFIDHAITIMWISMFVFTVLHFFIKSYQNQSQLLNKIKQRQEESLEEVKMLNDQKNKLIALLSHDLKNPIGMLHTTLGLVDKDAFEPGEMEQILRNLKGQSFHLNKVLNNTLSWVMTELEDTPIQLHQISLKELTQEMSEMMLVQAKEKNQSIETSIEGDDRNISLEINEIKIILKNLLDNAIKFSPVNSTINLDLRIIEEKLSWKVCNKGVTITKAEQKELFSFRARTSYGTKKEKGTGVGLPLCKRIADKINFDLQYSSSGEGHNCFKLSKKLS
ncbi:sensor histidine kinase [Algoriphagus aquimarinus]|uniref:histidine kinase n=1 Tax=Algoriphagus aquimarinus TaxID=237018 RepID=A0A1I0ZL32_9BACT|nr:HAMP domain-containing sensor histidine kinase [Algoriphagus aquimarinus]SFB26062.1 Signal transduction histidine kinase [Algoriphagus aquimarinus]|tara:strand:+ start:3287 stop:4594 length:1308 start_codon:yes stop_codon:yes gene_type:complete